jgi:phosphoesterase RecJ-like protein
MIDCFAEEGDTVEEILEILRTRDNFILAGHTGPDGDAIGSCFALALALNDAGKKVRVMLESYARKYNIIPGREFLFTEKIEDIQMNDVVFIALDCADVERLGAARVLFERAEVTVCIDHHETNTGFAAHNYILPEASSTSEMTFRLIEKLIAPTTEIAAAVYAGMVSDTGGFRFNATAKSTMETAARLMEMIPFTEIYNELMHQHRFAAGKIMALALQNSQRTRNKKIVYTFISREMLKSVGADLSDLDGVVEYLMGTRKALAAIFVYEKSAEHMKVSLRSQGPNMGRVAAELGGGGHALAAGANVRGTIEEVLKQTLKLVAKEVKLYVRK